MIYSLLVYLLGCFQHAEHEKFLIPENFTGTIVIFFDQKGSPIEYNQDSIRIYRVPDNGVLKSGLPRAKGVLNQKFYYVDSTGSILKELKYTVDVPNQKQKKETYVYGIFDGKMTINPDVNVARTKYSNTKSKKVDYIYFSVGDLRMMEENIEKSHSRIEQVIKEMK